MRLSQMSPEARDLHARLAQAFGRVLRQARKATGLTYEQLAEEAEIEESTIEKLQNNRHSVVPSLTVLVALAWALGLEPGELLTRALTEAKIRPPRRRRNGTQAGMVAPGTGTSASTCDT